MELYHYGIEGMKWGVRRFQNEDGSLTELGRMRYGGKRSGKRREELRRAWTNRRRIAIKKNDRETANYANRQLQAINRMSDDDLAIENVLLDNAHLRMEETAKQTIGWTLLGGGLIGASVGYASARDLVEQDLEIERAREFASNYRNIPIDELRRRS